MIDNGGHVVWYKRSSLAPVWVTLVLAVVFGGILTLMSFDIRRLETKQIVAHHEARHR
jgi:hypothetical protein